MGMSCREIMEGLNKIIEPLGWETCWYNSGGGCMILQVNRTDHSIDAEDKPFLWITTANYVVPDDIYAGEACDSFSPVDFDTDLEETWAEHGAGEAWDHFHLGHYDNWEMMEESWYDWHFDHMFVKGVESLAAVLVATIKAFYVPIESEEQALAWTDALAFLKLDYHLDDDASGIVVKGAKRYDWKTQQVITVDKPVKLFSPLKSEYVNQRCAEWALAGGWGLFEKHPIHWKKFNQDIEYAEPSDMDTNLRELYNG